MEILLAAIAVVLIVLIVGVVLLKQKQKTATHTKKTAPMPHVAAHTTSDIDELLSTDNPVSTAPVAPAIAPVQAAIDPLVKAETFINDQRYDEATVELKRIILGNPSNFTAMLKLLQVYGITNNHKAFNTLHTQIHALGDAETIKNADFCRSLLIDDLEPAAPATPQKIEEDFTAGALEFDLAAEEMSSAPQMSNTPAEPETTLLEPILDNSFELSDFDLGGDEPETSPTAPPQVADEPVNLLLDEEFTDFSPQKTTSDTPLSEPTADTDFDLSFDELTELDTAPQPAAPAKTAIDEPSHELSLDTLGANFESNLEPVAKPAISTPPQPADETAFDLSSALDDDFGLSLDTPTQPVANKPAVVPAAAAKDTSDDFAADFALDLDLGADFDKPASTIETPKAETITQASEPASDFDSSFDTEFDLASLDTPATAPAVQTPAAVLDDAFDLSLDDLSIGDTSTVAEPAPASEPVLALDELSLDDLNFGDTTTQAPTPAPIDKPAPQSTPSDEFALDGLNLDDLDVGGGTPVAAPVPAAAVVSTPVAAAPTPAVAPPAQTVAPSAPISELNFGSSPDNSEITLNLANQYLNLGEQDSAKRLLAEVVKNGNPSQQDTAQKLLTRLG
ncbi:MAG: FimV/HubP family polar landmark protein [Moraxella sp.]|nr:FimV/HubP family polar landmark protein [Moraxella sp.]